MSNGDSSRRHIVDDTDRSELPGPRTGGGPISIDAEPIVAAFNRHGVRYVAIGAFAALQQGAVLPPTKDIDFTPWAGEDNLERLSAALPDLGARIRTQAVSGGLSSNYHVGLLARSEIWNLVCPYGEFDLSFRPDGTDGYEDLVRDARMTRIGEQDLPVASLDDIMRSKRAAGRPKDLRVLPVLSEALDREQQQYESCWPRRPPAAPAQP
jgi:hypothetical protein